MDEPIEFEDLRFVNRKRCLTHEKRYFSKEEQDLEKEGIFSAII